MKEILDALDDSAIHADLKSLFDDPERDVTQMFYLEEEEW